ncbi:MAG TPA: stage III sporulation protein AB [Tissierellaceae bacterium]
MLILKTLSLAIIFITCAILGYCYGQRFTLRYENLVSLEQCIKILETEIVYGATPLPTALSNVYKKGNPRVSYIFEKIKDDLLEKKRSFVFESFLEIEDELYGKMNLKKEDVEIMLSLGRVLGSSDRHDQSKVFKIVLNQIEAQIEDAKIEKNKNEKLYRNLGVLAGIGLIILLV